MRTLRISCRCPLWPARCACCLAPAQVHLSLAFGPEGRYTWEIPYCRDCQEHQKAFARLGALEEAIRQARRERTCLFLGLALTIILPAVPFLFGMAMLFLRQPGDDVRNLAWCVGPPLCLWIAVCLVAPFCYLHTQRHLAHLIQGRQGALADLNEFTSKDCACRAPAVRALPPGGSRQSGPSRLPTLVFASSGYARLFEEANRTGVH